MDLLLITVALVITLNYAICSPDSQDGNSGLGFLQFTLTPWRFDVINNTTLNFFAYSYISVCTLHDDILPPPLHDLWPVCVQV